MPGKKNRSLKKPDMYEDLREEGASKEKAARVSNAAAKEGTSTVSKRAHQSLGSGSALWGLDYSASRHCRSCFSAESPRFFKAIGSRGSKSLATPFSEKSTE